MKVYYVILGQVVAAKAPTGRNLRWAAAQMQLRYSVQERAGAAIQR